MSYHFNTEGAYPKTRAEVRALSDEDRFEFMSECPAEPADFEDCLACYAYGVEQGLTDEEMSLVRQWRNEQDDLADLIPQRIEVTAEQFDAIMEILDRPVQPCPALVELFARPTVFES